MKKTLLLSTILLAHGCTTAVTPMATGGSRADGVVEMSYEYGMFEQPNVDKVAALGSAVRRCKTWGYDGAEAFDAGMRTCISMSTSGCARWRVTTEYQCTHGNEGQVTAPSQQKYSSQVRKVAESMQCTMSATMVASTEESEKWVLVCGDGETLEVRCFDETCYVK